MPADIAMPRATFRQSDTPITTKDPWVISMEATLRDAIDRIEVLESKQGLLEQTVITLQATVDGLAV